MNAVAYSANPTQIDPMITLQNASATVTANALNYNNNMKLESCQTAALLEDSTPQVSTDEPTSSPLTMSGEGSPSSPDAREPEPNSIKMFVGQIPKTMEESELREMFGKFGEIYQLNVLRDKVTGQHRGCCFVTFYTRKSAIMAQDELHGRLTLPGMHHPIQMKPADNEKKNVEDRKLFIGMVSKKLSENDIRTLFTPFGAIEDCMILRDTSGVSRGCAFVTFAVRQSALNAIQHMHHSQTMEGCSSPLVVKFADTQKDKDVRTKLIPTNNNILTAAPFPAAGPPAMTAGGLPPHYLALFQQSLSTNGTNLAGLPGTMHNIADMTTLHNMQNLHGYPNMNLGYINQNNAGLFNTQSLLGLPAISTSALSSARTLASPTNGNNISLSTMAGLTNSPTSSGTNLTAVSTGPPQAAAQYGSAAPPVSLAGASMPLGGVITAMPSAQAAAASQLTSSAAAAQAAQAQAAQAAANQAAVDAALSQAYNGIAQYTASFPHAYAPVQPTLSADTPAGKQTEGPDGANLFIYHLPQEFLDQDLLQAFMPFGNVVSAKVFIDKQTNLSKCFGFVSFDNPLSAQAAIATMNGFQIGMKRLKVQLKRPKNESKPYCFSPLFYGSSFLSGSNGPAGYY